MLAGVGHVQLGCNTHKYARETDLREDSVGELWAHLCGIIAPVGLCILLGVGTGQIRMGYRTHLTFMGPEAGKMPGGARMWHLLAHARARSKSRLSQAGLLPPLTCLGSGVGEQAWLGTLGNFPTRLNFPTESIRARDGDTMPGKSALLIRVFADRI